MGGGYPSTCIMAWLGKPKGLVVVVKVPLKVEKVNDPGGSMMGSLVVEW